MVNIQLPDALLVKDYVAGNEDALAKLIKRHESKIYGFIYSKIQIGILPTIFSTHIHQK
jgi:RNA polymerase sigma-70 factor (ECF subfamily)